MLGGCGGNGEVPASSPMRGQGALDAVLTAPVQVRVAAARREDLQQKARVSGVVSAFRKATVAAEVAGRVVRRTVEPGSKVSAGQVLVALDAQRTRLARDRAAANLNTRQINAKEAESELVRGRNLFARQFISPDRLEDLSFAVERAHSELASAKAQLATAERALADTLVKAPFDGIAEAVHVQVGDYLKVGVAVATVADFSRVRVRAGVTAAEAERLVVSAGRESALAAPANGQSSQQGASLGAADAELALDVLVDGEARRADSAPGKTSAELGLDVLGGRRLIGTVNSVARISDPATGTYAVEIWVDGSQAILREGMLATVHLPYPAGPSRPTVPNSAVFRRDGTLHAFVVENGKAWLRPVRTGRRTDASVEVIEGLVEGDWVVIDGQFALRDGAPVNITQRS